MRQLRFYMFLLRWSFPVVSLVVVVLASRNLGICFDVWTVVSCLAVLVVDWRETFLYAGYRYHVISKVFCIVLCIAFNRSYSEYHVIGRLVLIMPLVMIMLLRFGDFFRQNFVRMSILMLKPIANCLLLFLCQMFLLGLNESHVIFPFICMVLLIFARTKRMFVVALLSCLLSEMILLLPTVLMEMFSVCRATTGVDVVCIGSLSFFDKPMSRLAMVPFVLIYNIMMSWALIRKMRIKSARHN